MLFFNFFAMVVWMADDLRTLVQETSLFSSCGEEELDEILQFCGRLNIRKGEPVFVTGQKAFCLYIVEKGEILIRRSNDEGQDVDIARLLPGDFFGELDMFTQEERNASAYAVADTFLIAFPGQGRDFYNMEGLSFRTRARLFLSFLVQVSARIRSTNALVKENSPVMQELKRQVYVDKLTGLFNKTCFEEELKTSLASCDTLGLLMYKPDNFKTINDSYGHEAGDLILRFIADKLKEWVPEQEQLFRYMGNENALILPNASREELAGMAEKMSAFLRNLNLSEVLGEDKMKLSVSFGLALYPVHGRDGESLVQEAHPLTLEGRRRGGNMILFPEDREAL